MNLNAHKISKSNFKFELLLSNVTLSVSNINVQSWSSKDIKIKEETKYNIKKEKKKKDRTFVLKTFIWYSWYYISPTKSTNHLFWYITIGKLIHRKREAFDSGRGIYEDH